jgi:uncharacterized protein (DUF2141 family)
MGSHEGTKTQRKTCLPGDRREAAIEAHVAPRRMKPLRGARVARTSFFVPLCLRVKPLFLLPLLAASGPATVDVTVTGLRSAKGALSVCVMPDKRGFPACEKGGGVKQRVAITGTAARVRFPGLPTGRYAVTAFHDEDGDGRLKTNFIGIPREGVGVSGKPGGIPSFDKAAVPIGPGTAVTLAIRYL